LVRTQIISVRISPEERRWLERLAQEEERTLGDTLRRVIRRAAQSDERPAKAEAFSISRP
jgi:hypothetical protein